MVTLPLQGSAARGVQNFADMSTNAFSLCVCPYTRAVFARGQLVAKITDILQRPENSGVPVVLTSGSLPSEQLADEARDAAPNLFDRVVGGDWEEFIRDAWPALRSECGWVRLGRRPTHPVSDDELALRVARVVAARWRVGLWTICSQLEANRDDVLRVVLARPQTFEYDHAEHAVGLASGLQDEWSAKAAASAAPEWTAPELRPGWAIPWRSAAEHRADAALRAALLAIADSLNFCDESDNTLRLKCRYDPLPLLC